MKCPDFISMCFINWPHTVHVIRRIGYQYFTSSPYRKAGYTPRLMVIISANYGYSWVRVPRPVSYTHLTLPTKA